MKKGVLFVFGIFVLVYLVENVSADCVGGWTEGNNI